GAERILAGIKEDLDAHLLIVVQMVPGDRAERANEQIQGDQQNREGGRSAYDQRGSDNQQREKDDPGPHAGGGDHTDYRRVEEQQIARREAGPEHHSRKNDGEDYGRAQVGLAKDQEGDEAAHGAGGDDLAQVRDGPTAVTQVTRQ